MGTAISHSYAVIDTGKFQKRQSTYEREQARMPVYYQRECIYYQVITLWCLLNVALSFIS